MAFVTKTWKDRLVEYAGRRKLKNVATGEEILMDVSRSEGTVNQAGDAFSAANMNNLEQRIKTEFDSVNSSLEKLSSPTILWSGEIQPTTSEKVLTHVNLDMTDDIRNYNYLVITVDNNNSPTNHQYEDLYFIVQDIIDFGFNDNIRLQKTIVGNSTSMANVGFRIPDNNYNRLRVSVFNQGSYRAKILKIRGIK